VIREELGRLTAWSEHHERLVARLSVLILATVVVDLVATVANYYLERHGKQTDVKTLFDSFFYTSVQLVTVSSSLRNPVTVGGKVIDIFLELWGVLAIAGSAGAMASFFQSADR
jgi:hypothetical protein